jgi:hypothetical protein
VLARLSLRCPNNREQFSSHHVGRRPERAMQDLGISVGLAHKLRDDFAGHALPVRPRGVGAPEGQPRGIRESQSLAGGEDMAVSRLWPSSPRSGSALPLTTVFAVPLPPSSVCRTFGRIRLHAL